MAFRWRADVGLTLNGSFVIFRGSGPVLLRKPIFLYFVIFQRGPYSLPPPPSGSAHAGAQPTYTHLYLKLWLQPYSVYTINDGSDESAHLLRLVRGVLARQCSELQELHGYALFEAAKIHVQIMRFTCCLNMGLNLTKPKLGPDLFA